MRSECQHVPLQQHDRGYTRRVFIVHSVIDRTCINFEIINRDQPPFFSVSLRLLYSRPVRFAAPSRTANLRQPTIIRETEKRQSSLRDCTVFSRYAKLLSHIERILSNLAIHRLTCHSYCTPTLPTNFSHGVEHSETEPRCLYIERISRARTFFAGL